MEQVLAVIEKLLSFLDKDHRVESSVDGDIPLEFFTKPCAAADRDRLLDLRDVIDLASLCDRRWSAYATGAGRCHDPCVASPQGPLGRAGRSENLKPFLTRFEQQGPDT